MRKRDIPDLPRSELPEVTVPHVTGSKDANNAKISRTIAADGTRRREPVNGVRPIEQLASYQQWARVKGLKRTFIAHYSECGSLIIACNLTNVHPSAVRGWLAQDEVFRDDYDTATDTAISLLEHEARRRALAGSDRLLEFLLKSLKPEVYRERYEIKQESTGDYIIDISTPGQAAITPSIDNPPATVLDESSPV